MTRLNVLYCLLFSFAQSFSQTPVITRPDVEAGFTNTERVERTFTIVPRMENLGIPSGSPQTFNFATVPGTVTGVDTERTLYVPPSGQPGASFFPSATTAGKLIDSSGGQVITIAQYFRIQDDGAYFLGFAERIQQGASDTTAIFMYNPPALFLPLPLTVGTNRTSSDTLDTPPIRHITLRSFTGDGYGTLTLPNGTTIQSVRVIAERTDLSYFGETLLSRQKARDIEYYGTDLSIASFHGVDTLYTSGSTTVREFEYNVRTGTTSVRQDNETIPVEFSLENYPNPFNPSTVVKFSIPVGAGLVPSTLKVFDVLGQEVATLVDERLPAGSYKTTWNAADLPSGVYMIRLLAGEKSTTLKTLLMK